LYLAALHVWKVLTLCLTLCPSQLLSMASIWGTTYLSGSDSIDASWCQLWQQICALNQVTALSDVVPPVVSTLHPRPMQAVYRHFLVKKPCHRYFPHQWRQHCLPSKMAAAPPGADSLLGVQRLAQELQSGPKEHANNVVKLLQVLSSARQEVRLKSACCRLLAFCDCKHCTLLTFCRRCSEQPYKP
jgi:hypothetical protein